METYFEKLNTIFDRNERYHSNRLVVKVGSSTIMSSGGEINHGLLNSLARQTSDLMDRGFEVVIVTSGAVACGRRRLMDFNGGMVGKQVLATVGQRYLENAWGEAFDSCNRVMGYSLISEKDLADITEHHEWPLLKALEHQIVPVINANDATNRFELKQLNISADNDQLAGFVARRIQAGRLILLTDEEGVWDKDKRIIETMTRSQDLERVFQGEKSREGTGGMASKIDVAMSFALNGRVAYIARGQRVSVLTDIIDGRNFCTRVQMVA